MHFQCIDIISESKTLFTYFSLLENCFNLCLNLTIISLAPTGTCISSLSNRYIGAFSNRRELSSRLIEAGERSGERLWPFPVDEDFEEDLLSDVADVLQVCACVRVSVKYCV